MITNILIASMILLGIVWFLRKEKRGRQLRFLEQYKFSPVLLKRVQKQHDYLRDEDLLKVAKATKEYFIICHMAKGKMVAMPSQIVDVLWHEFILFTREYEQFCKQGLGTFLHHVPTEAMKDKTQAGEGIKRAWRLACAREGINPKNPDKLPLLFHIDKTLNIVDGFKYDLDCKKIGQYNNSACAGYCATDINCTSGCVGESGGHESSHSDWFGGDGDSGHSCSSCSSCGGGS